MALQQDIQGSCQSRATQQTHIFQGFMGMPSYEAGRCCGLSKRQMPASCALLNY
jgi:hypothetical protein